jgi:hypothetical protein
MPTSKGNPRASPRSFLTRHLPSNVVALDDHDGMARADLPERWFHKAPPTAEHRPPPALVQSRRSPIKYLAVVSPAASLLDPPFAPKSFHTLCRFYSLGSKVRVFKAMGEDKLGALVP